MTAVEWLIEELKKVHHPTEAMIMYAKKLEKQQIIDAHISGYDSSGGSAEDYYQHYYGSKGSDGTLNSSLNSTLNSSSQTEISDEEIDKAADYFFPNLGESTKYSIWRMGARWYREQLKKKQ